VKEKVNKVETGKVLEILGPPRSNATMNRFTDWLRHVLNWAVKQKRIRENPVLAIERKPEDEAPIYQYSLDQEARLIEQLNEEEVDLLRLAILTGLRQGNQFHLRKEQIQPGNGCHRDPAQQESTPTDCAPVGGSERDSSMPNGQALGIALGVPGEPLPATAVTCPMVVPDTV
jgi:hypothetical protein